MAICDLDKKNKEISVDTVKELITSNVEWKNKLTKDYFIDKNIAWAIKESNKLFQVIKGMADMPNIGESERKTQNRIVEFFQNKLGYKYIGDLHDYENSNIRKDELLKSLLSRDYSQKIAEKAIEEFHKVSTNLQKGLYSANKEVYSLLKYGIKICENTGEAPKTVYFIDFEDFSNNDFYIAEEVSIVGNSTKRPDVVVFVNGIALAVVELKKSSVSVSNGIRQNLTNQKSYFIENFFTTIQFCMAGNDSEGLRYGTLLTPEKYYLEWKEDGFKEFKDEIDITDTYVEESCKTISEKLESQIYAIFYKKRFLDLIHNFVIYDKGIKKVCRYNQYYAIKRTQNRITKKQQGGIIWHTQGSGKSLTMVWLSKWILANNSNSRILIITDREELDEQIEKIYKGVDEKIIRTKSGNDLVNNLNYYDNRLICSLIHKFGRRSGEIENKDYDEYIKDLQESLPKDFSVKGDIYIFVDECHRTQSGKLHKAMKTILPKGLFIGFTGTPLLKKDKATSLEVFEGYIHTYKFDEGVRDGIVLDLRYEYRNIPQDITSQERIDEWFEVKTQGLAQRAKARLKSHWGNLQKVFSSRSRLEKIANDIIVDFEIKTRLADGNGNAILTAGSIYSACKYYEIFQSKGFKKIAIISSYEPQIGNLRNATVSDEEETETFEKYDIYNKMLNGQSTEDFEREAKRKFVEEPANMKLLIVVDKLLTGFDAPPCTYLYIDKAMHDHGLFQAICRVNRLDDETKDFGYIVDYKELFGDLSNAMNKYTAGAFEDYEPGDVEGLIKDRTTEAMKFFEETLDALEELCDGVELPREQLNFIHYFCGENGVDIKNDEIFSRARENLYKLVSRLVRAYAEVKLLMNNVSYTSIQQEQADEKVTFYIELREYIGRASGDFIDLKLYEPGMRFLIDNYIIASDSQKLGTLDDFTLLDFIILQGDNLTSKSRSNKESAAEAIENNIRKKVIEKIVINPKYYEKMSEVLEQLILERKQKVISYKQLLSRYIELAKKVDQPENNTHYPESIRKSETLRSLYDNCGENEELVMKIHSAIIISKMDGFRNNPVKENKIKRELSKIFNDDQEVERIYKIASLQKEY